MRALKSLPLWALAALMLVSAVTAASPPDPPRRRALSLTAVDKEPARRGVPSAEAIAELAAAVRKEPKDRRLRMRHVRALLAAGRLPEALRAVRAWRAVDAYNLVVMRLLGDVHAELGDRHAARRAYSSVVELLPDEPEAHRALATVLKQSGDVEAAYHRLRVAARLRPDDVRIAFELADASQRLGRSDEAAERFEAIVKASAPETIRYPAKQRLAQIYAARRLKHLADGDADKAEAVMAAIRKLNVKGGAVNDIKVYLTWDTDRSDVDLWVVNPAGEKVFYSHKRGRFGGALYHDVTSGYGPESFTAHRAAPGTYVVKVHYYGTRRRTFPEARGEVVVVLNEGRDSETRHVLPYRLFEAGQAVTVATVTVGKEESR